MAGSTPMVSPGVRVNVVDQSNYTPLANVPGNMFAIVGGANFGPIGVPTVITSANQFESIFGEPADIAGLTAINVVNNGGSVYYCRFAGDSAAARSATLTGTSGNLKITANYKGIIKAGAWKAVVTAGSGANFILTITRTQGSTTETVIPATELSLNDTDDNYFTTRNNSRFTIAVEGDAAPTAITPGTYNFSDGNNGIDATFANNATAVKAALDVFNDRESYNLFYLSVPDYSTIEDVAKEIVAVSNSRKDCICQIDHPYDADHRTADSIITALSPYTGAQNNEIALWAISGAYLRNPYENNAEVLAPASAFILPALAAEYLDNPVWTAPASNAYLQITNISTLEKNWNQDDRDKLYAANINPILNYRGLGYTALGQKSGQTKKTAMDRLNVVQLVNYCRTGIERISVDFLFAPIDDETFSAWIYRVGNFLSSVKASRGLYDYSVKMDWETVTSDAVNNNLMPGIVKIKPTKVAEFIDVDLIIKNYSDTL